MKNEEKADELYPYYEDMTDLETFQTASRRVGFIDGAEWKDEQINAILKIISPMIYGGQKNEIRDILGKNINWNKL